MTLTLKQQKNDLAEERRMWVETCWFRGLDLTISVPKPDVSNREFDRRSKMGQQLFYRPSTSDMSHDAFMRAVGQPNHWTVVHEDRNKVIWETAEQGYWFWAEISDNCPRTGTSWYDLSRSIRLPSLEEYMIVWHAYKAQTGKFLDRNTWCWLRTRYRYSEKALCALRASGYGGGVSVFRWPPGYLSLADSDSGGRLVEVVKNVS